MQLGGKVVLITGASEGIGAACADVFRARGARLSLTARSEQKLAAVGGVEAVITPGDITEPDTRERCVARTLERFGRIDILVNNAGMGIYRPSWSAPMPETRRMVELNLFVPIAMIEAVVPHMRERKTGMIVNVGSIAGKITVPWLTLYSASKYALGALTNGLRMELGRDGIQALQVCPGYVHTQFQKHALGRHPPESVVRGKRFAISPEKCAEDIARGIERDARTVMTPGMGWALVAAARLFPATVDNYMRSLYEKQGDEPQV